MKMDWKAAESVANKYGELILSLPGVVGISTGVLKKTGEAQPCLRVYLSKPLDRGGLEEKKIPWEIEGVPVDTVVTGHYVALKPKP